MPSHFEYVFAAYGIWAFVFALYVLWLVRRSRAVKRRLEQLRSRDAGPSGETRA